MAHPPPDSNNGAGELELVAALTPEQRAALEAELRVKLAAAIDGVLDAFEACEYLEFAAMPVIVERLEARGVELPPWVEMML